MNAGGESRAYERMPLMDWTKEESAYERALADIGELAGPVTHEFNDILNTILLHIAVLEQSVPKASGRDLAEIRQQSMRIAGLVRQFQSYRHRQRPADHPLELNALINETAAAFP